MIYRSFGRSGIKVSPYCLGAMMFGSLANTDTDECIVAAGEENSRLNFLELERHPLFALMKAEDATAPKRTASLEDFDDRVWVLFGKHVHRAMHDLILSRAEELGIKPSEIHYFTTAEEAAYLVAKHEGIAFLNRTSAWRVARNGLTMRPIDEPTLAVKTTLSTSSLLWKSPFTLVSLGFSSSSFSGLRATAVTSCPRSRAVLTASAPVPFDAPMIKMRICFSFLVLP
jgi:LysR substrate binding domain